MPITNIQLRTWARIVTKEIEHIHAPEPRWEHFSSNTELAQKRDRLGKAAISASAGRGCASGGSHSSSLINASRSRFPSNYSSVLSPNVGNDPEDDSKDNNGHHQHAHVFASSLTHAPNSILSLRRQVHRGRQMAYGSRARVATGARSRPRLRSEFLNPHICLSGTTEFLNCSTYRVFIHPCPYKKLLISETPLAP